MKLYLAGPMRGIRDFNFPVFNRVAAALRSAGYEVFNPAEKGLEKHKDAALESLEFRRAVFALDTEWICQEADGVALLAGWEVSKGACAEKALADALGIPAKWWNLWISDPKSC